jgi:transketolase
LSPKVLERKKINLKDKTPDLVATISEKARLLRAYVLKMTTLANSGHPGGSLSAADIIAVLYFNHLKHDPQNPKWQDRDRFILSKGHAAPILYAALAECGYFEKETLWTLRKLGSILQGHPDMRKVPGVEISTGSLGHGFAAANGFALAGRIDNKNYQVYVMIGDGECQEGEIWEAAMFAAHYKLNNLVAILDYNGLQIDGTLDEVMSLEPLADKWRSFGWKVIEINGHDISQIIDSLNQAKQYKKGPCVIIAGTVKGKGVSFMENVADFHGKALSEEQMNTALSELGFDKGLD